MTQYQYRIVAQHPDGSRVIAWVTAPNAADAIAIFHAIHSQDGKILTMEAKEELNNE